MITHQRGQTMSNLQLVIKTPDNAFLKAVEFNFEELQAGLKAELEKYQGLTYTDETIKDAKTDRAKLKKLQEAMSNARISVKKRCLEPYEEFERKIKILDAIVGEPMLAIDSQVKGYVKRKKDEKKALILDYYEANIGDVKEIMTFEAIFNKKWLNATSSLKSIQSEISNKIEQVKKDLETLNEINSEFITQIKGVYLKTFDIGEALREKKRLDEEKARIEAYEQKQRAEAEAKAKEQETKSLITKRADGSYTASLFVSKEETQQSEADAIDSDGGIYEIKTTPEPDKEKLYELSFKVIATAEQLGKLKAFFINNGITYEKV